MRCVWGPGPERWEGWLAAPWGSRVAAEREVELVGPQWCPRSQRGFLSQACRYGHVQHLEHLLFYGADMGAQNASGNTALHICALYNQVSVLGPRRTPLGGAGGSHVLGAQGHGQCWTSLLKVSSAPSFFYSLSVISRNSSLEGGEVWTPAILSRRGWGGSTAWRSQIRVFDGREAQAVCTLLVVSLPSALSSQSEVMILSLWVNSLAFA